MRKVLKYKKDYSIVRLEGDEMNQLLRGRFKEILVGKANLLILVFPFYDAFYKRESKDTKCII